MRRTTEIDFGFSGGTASKNNGQSASSDEPERFPTPTATDSQASRRETCNDGEGLPNANPGETLCDRVRKFPTPTKADAEGGPGCPGREGGDNLRTVVDKMPTPTAGDAERTTAAYPRGNPTLNGAAQMWPTPRSADGMAKEVIKPEMLERTGESRLEVTVAHRKWATPTTNDANNANLPESQADWDNIPGQLLRNGYDPGGRLNPYWVEWLMGWPIGWTASELPATARSPTRWLAHGLCLVIECAAYWTAGR